MIMLYRIDINEWYLQSPCNLDDDYSRNFDGNTSILGYGMRIWRHCANHVREFGQDILGYITIILNTKCAQLMIISSLIFHSSILALPSSYTPSLNAPPVFKLIGDIMTYMLTFVNAIDGRNMVLTSRLFCWTYSQESVSTFQEHIYGTLSIEHIINSSVECNSIDVIIKQLLYDNSLWTYNHISMLENALHDEILVPSAAKSTQKQSRMDRIFAPIVIATICKFNDSHQFYNCIKINYGWYSTLMSKCFLQHCSWTNVLHISDRNYKHVDFRYVSLYEYSTNIHVIFNVNCIFRKHQTIHSKIPCKYTKQYNGTVMILPKAGNECNYLQKCIINPLHDVSTDTWHVFLQNLYFQLNFVGMMLSSVSLLREHVQCQILYADNKRISNDMLENIRFQNKFNNQLIVLQQCTLYQDYSFIEDYEEDIEYELVMHDKILFVLDWQSFHSLEIFTDLDEFPHCIETIFFQCDLCKMQLFDDMIFLCKFANLIVELWHNVTKVNMIFWCSKTPDQKIIHAMSPLLDCVSYHLIRIGIHFEYFKIGVYMCQANTGHVVDIVNASGFDDIKDYKQSFAALLHGVQDKKYPRNFQELVKTWDSYRQLLHN